MMTNHIENNFVFSSISRHDHDWLLNVKEAIRDNLENANFNVSLLAEQFHLSRRQFQRRIKRLTGLSPKQLQQEIALNKAKKLLEQQIYTNITAVGYSVGINNATRFSKMYSTRFGENPSKYFHQLVSG